MTLTRCPTSVVTCGGSSVSAGAQNLMRTLEIEGIGLLAKSETQARHSGERPLAVLRPKTPAPGH
jgi:hypothetical protein